MFGSVLSRFLMFQTTTYLFEEPFLITCPSTGKPCYAEVCNAGAWPCDPAMMARAMAPIAPRFERDDMVETDEGFILSGPAEDDGARFAIEP